MTWPSFYQLLFSVALATLLSACGSNSGPTGPSSSSSSNSGSQPPRLSNTRDLTGSVTPFGTNQHSVTAEFSGNLQATLSWSDSSIDLDLYLTSSSCNSYPPSNCTIIDQGNRSTGTSERVSKNVARGETVKLWVDNFDRNRGSSYRLSLTLTTSDF